MEYKAITRMDTRAREGTGKMTPRTTRIAAGAVVSLLLLSAAACSGPEAPTTAARTGVDAKADELLHRMSSLLASSESFTFSTQEAHEHLRHNGETRHVRMTKEVSIRRPSALHMRIAGGEQDGEVFYDGKTVSLLANNKKMWAQAHVPPTLDEMMDYVAARLDIPMPMADVLYSNPYESLMTDDTRGSYVGEEPIEGSSCHHLSFQQEALDWQIWIAAGDQPLPCRLVIVYKQEQGPPRSQITFSNWRLAEQLADTTFAFQPPPDYQRIRIVGRKKMEQVSEAAAKERVP